MKFLLNLISPFAKYKWAIIGGLWLSSLLYLNNFKNNQCEANNLKSVVSATQEQSKDADKADIALNDEQSNNKKEAETGVHNVIEYREKIKTIKTDCPVDPIVNDDLIRLYDNTNSDKAKNPD